MLEQQLRQRCQELYQWLQDDTKHTDTKINATAFGEQLQQEYKKFTDTLVYDNIKYIMDGIAENHAMELQALVEEAKKITDIETAIIGEKRTELAEIAENHPVELQSLVAEAEKSPASEKSAIQKKFEALEASILEAQERLHSKKEMLKKLEEQFNHFKDKAKDLYVLLDSGPHGSVNDLHTFKNKKLNEEISILNEVKERSLRLDYCKKHEPKYKDFDVTRLKLEGEILESLKALRFKWQRFGIALGLKGHSFLTNTVNSFNSAIQEQCPERDKLIKAFVQRTQKQIEQKQQELSLDLQVLKTEYSQAKVEQHILESAIKAVNKRISNIQEKQIIASLTDLFLSMPQKLIQDRENPTEDFFRASKNDAFVVPSYAPQPQEVPKTQKTQEETKTQEKTKQLLGWQSCAVKRDWLMTKNKIKTPNNPNMQGPITEARQYKAKADKAEELNDAINKILMRDWKFSSDLEKEFQLERERSGNKGDEMKARREFAGIRLFNYNAMIMEISAQIQPPISWVATLNNNNPARPDTVTPPATADLTPEEIIQYNNMMLQDSSKDPGVNR